MLQLYSSHSLQLLTTTTKRWLLSSVLKNRWPFINCNKNWRTKENCLQVGYWYQLQQKVCNKGLKGLKTWYNLKQEVCKRGNFRRTISSLLYMYSYNAKKIVICNKVTFVSSKDLHISINQGGEDFIAIYFTVSASFR